MRDGLRLLAEEIADIVVAKLSAAQSQLNKRVFTLAEAASYCGLSEDAIRAKVNRNEMPRVRIDGRLRFDRKELDRWIEANTRFEDAR